MIQNSICATYISLCNSISVFLGRNKVKINIDFIMVPTL